MRKTITTVALLLALVAPAAAAWRQDANSLTWHASRATADMAQLRDALLWHYEGTALDGALATSARPRIALTDLGGGNSELSITMGRAAGDAWVGAYAARACPDATTNAQRAACVDAAIKSDLRRIWSAYRHHLREQATPVAEVPDLP